MVPHAVVQPLSRVQLFVTQWTSARQASLSIINSRSLLKLMSMESMMPSNHRILCHRLLLSFPASGSFPMNQLLASSGQSIGASASVLSVNIQSCFPLGLIILISLQSMGLSRVISNTTVQKHQFFDIQPSLWSNSHIHTWLLKKNHSFDYMDLCHKVMSLLFNMLSRFVIAFVSRRREFFFQKAVLPSLLIS